LTTLKIVDFCDCEGLYPSALNLMLRKNLHLEDLQLSGCTNAVDDTSMNLISKQDHLEFLDISYCKQVTDGGLYFFYHRELPLTAVSFNGLSKISSQGLCNFLVCCTKTLVDLELGNNDQEMFKSDCMTKIG
jgi:hypothetical protein